MANPGNVIAAYKKIGARVALVGEINAATSTAPEFELLNTNYSDLFPDPNKSVEDWGMPSAGSPLKTAQNFTLGRVEPDFALTLPLTEYGLSIGLISLCQYEGYVGSPDFAYKPVPNGNLTASVASLFMNVEAGIAGSGSTVYKVQGCVVKTLKVTAPPVGPDRGKVMMEWTVLAANSTPATAFTSASPTVDPGTPILSDQYVVSIDTGSGSGAIKHVGFDITMDNNAAKGLNAGATPDHHTLGDFMATGNLSVLLTSSTDEYKSLVDAYRAKTVVEIIHSVGSHHNFSFDVILTAKPSLSKQGNVWVCSFPWRAVNVDATRPSFAVVASSNTDYLNWATS